MKKDDRVYLAHMRDAMNRIVEYTACDKRDFMANHMAQDAVVRQFEILGEAAKRVSESFRLSHPEVPWSDMARLRDKSIHDYMGISIEMFWVFSKDNVRPDLERIIGILKILGEPE
jgi:uncharacterized protein with HEPN domain